MKKTLLPLLIVLVFSLAACNARPANNPSSAAGLKILAAEPFLADIAQNVAGNVAHVDSLIPEGMDPHAFEPGPTDVAKIAQSQVLIINGGGMEDAWLQKTIANAGGKRTLIDASSGLTPRTPGAGEAADGAANTAAHDHEGDPHFWLDPNLVIRYVENIRDGLSGVDPAHKAIYAGNAAVYVQKLNQLNTWIQQQVDTIPPENRLLVTNHESLGYFADRYGFKIVGTIIPSFSSLASPSAQQISQLIDAIRKSGVKAIFIEIGSNPDLADQISSETGVKVVSTLYDHSLTAPDGPAPTYLDMMRYDTTTIVEALK